MESLQTGPATGFTFWDFLWNMISAYPWLSLAFLVFLIVLALLVFLLLVRGKYIRLGTFEYDGRPLAHDTGLLADNAKRQSMVINLVRTTARNLSYFFSGEWDGESHEKIDACIRAILEGLPIIMSSSGEHRCSIMIPRDEHLVVLGQLGHGYPQEWLRKLELKIFDHSNPPDPRKSPVGHEGKVVRAGSCAAMAFLTGEPYYAENKSKDPYWIDLPGRDKDYGSIYCEPLITGTTIHGVLNIDAEEIEGFSQEDRRNIEILANFIAALIAIKTSSRQQGVIRGEQEVE